MPWLGHPDDPMAKYFPRYKGECGYYKEGLLFGATRRVINGEEWPLPHEYALRNVDHSRCAVQRGAEFDWCISHWLKLDKDYSPRTLDGGILPTVQCPHCSELATSKGEQKRHMQKSHKDILEARRREWQDSKSKQ